MAFSWRNCVFLTVFVAVVYVELYEGQYVVGRCNCPEVQIVSKINVSDFQVREASSVCNKTEIILTSITPNSTDKICVDTRSKIAKNFLRCWQRINKDENRKMECIEKKRRADEKASQV